MVKIRWTLRALDDIDDIAEFISQDSEKYARIQVDRFFNAVDILRQQPNAGRIVPEVGNSSLRELISGNYRLIYRIISDSQIDMIAVHHSRRQLPDDIQD